ncbi:MAG: hypothetical protein CM15mP65_01410 [Crocinitomicaceae bacterium]|nr:MAG: hypothetical protein CM15mP65_01410 [Crocinitomicaceae bacterium]
MAKTVHKELRATGSAGPKGSTGSHRFPGEKTEPQARKRGGAPRTQGSNGSWAKRPPGRKGPQRTPGALRTRSNGSHSGREHGTGPGAQSGPTGSNGATVLLEPGETGARVSGNGPGNGSKVLLDTDKGSHGAVEQKGATGPPLWPTGQSLIQFSSGSIKNYNYSTTRRNISMADLQMGLMLHGKCYKFNTFHGAVQGPKLLKLILQTPPRGCNYRDLKRLNGVHSLEMHNLFFGKNQCYPLSFNRAVKIQFSSGKFLLKSLCKGKTLSPMGGSSDPKNISGQTTINTFWGGIKNGTADAKGLLTATQPQDGARGHREGHRSRLNGEKGHGGHRPAGGPEQGAKGARGEPRARATGPRAHRSTGFAGERKNGGQAPAGPKEQKITGAQSPEMRRQQTG